MYPNKLKTWLSQFKQYYFTYSKGFYHLPYNGASPQSLIESFDGFPFVKHSKPNQHIYSNNPFCKGGFYYQQLEEGCWIIYSKMLYKANVAYDLIYNSKRPDDLKDFQDEDYYMLSLNKIQNIASINNDVCQKLICFPQFSWTFFKPKERLCDLNFKGSDNKYLTLYFNNTWLRKNLLTNKLFVESGLNRFIQSERRYIIWPLKSSDTVLENFDLFEKVMHIGGQAAKVDLLHLKFTTLHLIFEFFKYCRETGVVENSSDIDYEDKFSMNKVAHYLRSNLFEKFPGVNFLAKKFNVSQTKLKTEFKQLFGKPLYQYFQDRQMDVAKELILENELLVKDLSYKFCYESPGKFSAAFKKCHGVTPSEVILSKGK